MQTLFSTSPATQLIYISQNLLYYFADNVTIASISVNTSGWYHCVVVYQANSRTTTLYINNTVLNIRAANNAVTLSPTLLFGHNGQSVLANAAIFNGTVDDIKIYNRVLNQSEITQLYNE